MAKRAARLQVGDVVEIVDSEHELFKCLGVVEDAGPPVRLAVVHEREFSLRQVRQVPNTTQLSWHELRSLAKQLQVPASGTREEIEIAVHDEMLLRGTEPVESPRRKFQPGDIVRVVDENDEYFERLGTVRHVQRKIDVAITVSPIEVRFKHYHRNQIELVGSR